MRLLAIPAGLRTLVPVVVFVTTIGAGICSADGAPDSTRALARSSSPADPARVRLARAVLERSAWNWRGVVENLEALDYSAEPTFADADRAAFLLADAYSRLGSRSSFVALARQVARWQRTSDYTRWIAFQLGVIEARGAVQGDSALARTNGGSAADALTAAMLLSRGEPAAALEALRHLDASEAQSPLVLYLEAQTHAAAGSEDVALWTRLAATDTSTALGRDLAGAARIRLATIALTRGERVSELLDGVSHSSRFSSRARHLNGLSALEDGERERGVGLLEMLLASDTSYAGRREVLGALGGASLERGDWDSALRSYDRSATDWNEHREALRSTLERGTYDALWESWNSNSPLAGAVVLDAFASDLIATELANASLDLRSRPDAGAPSLRSPAASAPPAYAVAPPSPQALEAVSRSRDALEESEGALLRTYWALEAEEADLASQRGYFGTGLERAHRERADLERRSALLDSLRRTLDALDARLRSVRDAWTRHVLERTRGVLATCEEQIAWMHGMRHLHLEGPWLERIVVPPAEYPSAAIVLGEEEALARAVQAFAERMVAEAPDLIARSYEEAWGPSLIGRAMSQDSLARRSLAWVKRLEVSVDSTKLARATSGTARDLERRLVSLERTADSLRVSDTALRASVAREAVQAQLAALESEREGIDYGLAVAAYGASVDLAAPDSSFASGARAHAVAPDTSGSAQGVAAADDPATVAERARAIAYLETFLARHPQSFARGEMRFRLADLLLVQARHDFHERMAAYVRDQSAGGAAGLRLPVLSHEAALALYRKILAEDRDFEHRDAVQFNAGMILADQGDPGSWDFFESLVTEHPGSPYVQEATLRMGDLRFNDKRFAESVPLFTRAAEGPDASLTAIALYKLGWAHYNEDRYVEAADAFRSVLDLYGSPRRAEIGADIEREAEAYFVHSLAGAGGAKAFASYFDRVGTRPYERKVLLSLGQHFRRFKHYAEALDVDALFIQRHPTDPDALTSAQRMIETHQRVGADPLVRATRLEMAPRFAPGSAWFQAQQADSVREAGSRFARSSYKAVALEYHLAARQKGSREDWRAALGLYEAILERWPKDAEAPELRLNAGEAGAQLGEYALALRHYREAATAGSDSVAERALWQRTAVSDAWYESSRSELNGKRSGLGRDSLAHLVVENADELIARFPEHQDNADLTWRQGNIAFAHGWFERSATDFERLATRWPADKRAPRATILRADAFFKLQRFDAAGAAYEQALAAAQRAGSDSLARRASEAIPVSYYKHAEAFAAADPGAHAKHAELFEQVATRWPGYEHAPTAQYRAGLAWLEAKDRAQGVRAMEALLQKFPKSEYLRDAHLEIAKAWESGDEKEKSAAAYARFAESFPKDSSAADAWLKSADLYASAGLSQKADAIRLDYVKRYPNDHENAMQILEVFARRDLERVDAAHPISAMLPPPPAPVAKAKKGVKAKPVVAPPAAPASLLAQYLKRAEAHPELASKDLLAQTAFLQGEEANERFAALKLTLPLAKSIGEKQKRLDAALVHYRRSIDHGISRWAHASSYRIGEALVGFGTALEHSERPADLQGDDLLAYEDVLLQRGAVFFDRGEQVWSDLLRQKKDEASRDEWVGKAQSALWQRIGSRFFFRPEMEFPLIAGSQPSRPRASDERTSKGTATARGDSSSPRASLRAEDAPR